MVEMTACFWEGSCGTTRTGQGGGKGLLEGCLIAGESDPPPPPDPRTTCRCYITWLCWVRLLERGAGMQKLSSQRSLKNAKSSVGAL